MRSKAAATWKLVGNNHQNTLLGGVIILPSEPAGAVIVPPDNF